MGDVVKRRQQLVNFVATD